MLILASKSPRRIKLLEGLGLAFTAVESSEEEIIPPNLLPCQVVMELARQKALNVFERTKGIVIGADTVVARDGHVLGKPADEAEAFTMLNLLSGHWHEVYTGICIKSEDVTVCEYEMTRVKFRTLQKDEIERYIKTKEPMDKAGAYGIQQKGSVLVEKIEGDYFNVVGLPLCHLGNLLKKHFDITII